MDINTNKFCALSTSPSWQAWLFHFNADLYRKFIKRLQESRGCGQNKDLMVEVLAEIDKAGGNDKLLAYLHQHYPHILVSKQAAPAAVKDSDEIFENYNPDLLTYPRRIIFEGEASELRSKVQSFLVDKIKSDFVIVGDRAYVEYLTSEDTAIKDLIPITNWRVALWRQKASK